MLNLSVRSIERLRSMGLPFYQVNYRSARYDEQEVWEWLKTHTHVVRDGTKLLAKSQKRREQAVSP